MAEIITVPLRERSYDICIDAGILKEAVRMMAPRLKSPRVIIVTDTEVGALYAPALHADCVAHGIRTDVITLPAGEATKRFEVFGELMDNVLALAPDRKTTLVALGGGVIGDITGFAASVLLRGVDFIQIPTSLLAQVDSSVGGKTGINSRFGKNLIGSFYQPLMVLVDTQTLETLPRRELLAGYAEILKYGLIGDAEFYAWLLRHAKDMMDGNADYRARAIAQSCRMKAHIVGRDERGSADRALLNFGHTFGHALGAEMGYDGRLLHGEAVAVGMVMACRLSEQVTGLSPEAGDGLIAHMQAMGMRAHPTEISLTWDVERLIAHMAGDKKAEAGALTFIVLDAVGEARVMKGIDPMLVRHLVESMVR